MKIFEVHYAGNYGDVVIRDIKAKDEADAIQKAKEYCDNLILRILRTEEVSP